MATNIGNLFVNFGVNATGFVKGTDKATKKLTQFQKHVQKVDKSLKLLKFGLAGFAGGIGVRSILGSFSKTIDELDRLGEISDKLKIGSDKLAGLTFAAEQNQSSAEAMIGALETLPVKAAQAAAGMKKIQRIFESLNIDAKSLQRLSPDQMFAKVSDAISGLQTQAERLRISEALFGSGGGSLLPLLEQGAGGLREMQRRAEELGIAVKRENIDKFDALKDSINETKKAWEGFKISLMEGGAIEGLANTLKGLSDAMTGFGLVGKEGKTFGQKLGEAAGWLPNVAGAKLAANMVIRVQTIVTEALVTKSMEWGIAAGTPADDRVAMEQVKRQSPMWSRANNRMDHIEKELAGIAASLDKIEVPFPKLLTGIYARSAFAFTGSVFKAMAAPIVNAYGPGLKSQIKSVQGFGPQIAEVIRQAVLGQLFRAFSPGKQATVAASSTAFSTDAFTAKRMDSPEAIQAENRFKQMAANIQNKQLLEQKTANQHLQRIERNVRQEAQIKVVEVGIVG